MLRRSPAAIASLTLLALLAACGNDSSDSSNAADKPAASPSASPSDSPSASGQESASESASQSASAAASQPSAAAAKTGPISGLKVAGTLGKSFDVSITKPLKADAITVDAITKGTGPALAEGDLVMTSVWIGNGTTKKQSVNSYESSTPQLLTVGAQNLPPAIIAAMKGQSAGSRVAVLSPPADAYGPQGNPQLELGPEDSVVFVLDFTQRVAQEPSGEAKKPAAWAPKPIETDGKISGLDFAGWTAPKKADLLVTKVIKGNGPVVKTGQSIYVNYLGQVPTAKTPFDESYSAGAPVNFPIGTGNVIKGWDQGLVGQTVGSRVILGIPPQLGYPDGNQQAGIEKGDWLYFVVDILAAS